MPRHLTHPSILAALTTLAVPSTHAAINFNFTYADVDNGSGLGFDDLTLGATRRATVESVGNYLNTVLDHDGQIDLRFDPSSNNANSSTLASAGPLFFTAPNRFANGLAFTHITTGSDPSTNNPDAFAQVNFGRNYNSDLDAPTASEFDLATVLLHEITHALGFLSLLNADGTSGITANGATPTNPGVFSVFDSFLVDGNGTNLFAAGGEYLGSPADLISSDVFFDTPEIRAVNGGNPAQLFAPNPFSDGSSIGHFDFSEAFDDFNQRSIMLPSIAPGQSFRQYSQLDLAVLDSIGYDLLPNAIAIPQPAALPLVLLGLSLVTLRRG